MKMTLAKPEHKVAFDDLATLLRKHAEKIDAAEMLAIASNMVGKIVAMQDQRTMTPARAMEIVAKNVEAGNAEVLAQMNHTANDRGSMI